MNKIPFFCFQPSLIISYVTHNHSCVVLQSYCSKNMDLWWKVLVSLLVIEEDEEQREISWMKFWLVINPPSWTTNKCCFSSRVYTVGLFIILIILILQEWLSATHFFQHDINVKLWPKNEFTVNCFTKEKWSHL